MSWYLQGSAQQDRASWAELLQALGDAWTASWADHHGFHQEALPAEPPRTTHLWAWRTGSWLRARIDHDSWWAALLTAGSPATAPLWKEPEPIEQPDITWFQNWGDAREAKQFRGNRAVLHQNMVQLVPLLPITAVFIGDEKSHPR